MVRSLEQDTRYFPEWSKLTHETVPGLAGRLTGVPLQRALVIACLELPNLDGPVLGATGELRVLWVERQACHVGAVSLHGVLGRRNRQVQVFYLYVGLGPGLTVGQLFLQELDLVL